MAALDYLPILIAFAMALVGISGKTWDEEKTNLAKITPTGWAVLVISSFSLAYGVWTVHQNHSSLEERKAVALLARIEIFRGLQFLMHPVCGDLVNSNTDTATAFKVLQSKEHIERIGREAVAGWLGGRIFANTESGGTWVSQPYEADDVESSEGRSQIEHAVQKYSGYLDALEIAAFERLLQTGS